MKVIVLGAGIVGITTAYQLAKSGCAVTVIDRQPGAALETSFANAGQLSFGFSSPWAAPGIPHKAFKWLLMEHAPLVLRPRPDPAMIAWLLQMLGNCTARRYAINKGRMLRLSDYSRQSFAALGEETEIAYDGESRGTLQLFRTQQQVDACQKDVAALAADGIPFRLLDREGCIAAEPALARQGGKFAGGLLTPNDQTGDCHIFATRLAAKAAEMGVRFQYGTEITGLNVEAGAISGVGTAGGMIACDSVVMAMGSYSAKALRPLGLRIPVYPVKGYSLTIPITDESLAPRSTVMDETYKIAITRLGNRIRVGGMAEISGYGLALDPARRKTLEYSVSDLFPGGDLAKASFWTGLRPMTPDGTPIIGPTGVKGLYLNTGHGTLGWTMSAGSARLLADLITGRTPEIAADDYGVGRYRG